MILLSKVRSILLRGFDQQMANKIGEYMEEHGVNMVRECVPESIEKIEEVGREREVVGWSTIVCSGCSWKAEGDSQVQGWHHLCR